MPEVMLKRDWPNSFNRTITIGKNKTRLRFEPGEPVELNSKQIEALKPDIGVALMPCERDSKGRTRLIGDEVDTETDEQPEESDVSQSV